MSNIKQVKIEAVVDYCILEDDQELAAIIGRLAFAVSGWEVKTKEVGYRANRGGRTCQVLLTITGEEAVNIAFCRKLATRLSEHICSDYQYVIGVAFDLEDYGKRVWDFSTGDFRNRLKVSALA